MSHYGSFEPVASFDEEPAAPETGSRRGRALVAGLVGGVLLLAVLGSVGRQGGVSQRGAVEVEEQSWQSYTLTSYSSLPAPHHTAGGSGFISLTPGTGTWATHIPFCECASNATCATQVWDVLELMAIEELDEDSPGFEYFPTQNAWPDGCNSTETDPTAADWDFDGKTECCRARCIEVDWCYGISMRQNCGSATNCTAYCHLLTRAESEGDPTNTSEVSGDWETEILQRGHLSCSRANQSDACIDPVLNVVVGNDTATTECRQQVGDDDCASFPCKNDGYCIDGDDSFSCDCRIGWRGDLCDQPSYISYAVILGSRAFAAAATEADVYVAIHGQGGRRTRETLISSGIAANDTASGAIMAVDVGVPSAVTYRAAGPDSMFLEYVEVVAKGNTYITDYPTRSLPVSQWHVAATVDLKRGTTDDLPEDAAEAGAELLAAAEAMVQGNLTVSGLNAAFFEEDATMRLALLDTIATQLGVDPSSIVLTVMGGGDNDDASSRRLAEAVASQMDQLIVQFQIVLPVAEFEQRGALIASNFTEIAGGANATDPEGEGFIEAFKSAALALNPDSELRSLYLTSSVSAEPYEVPEPITTAAPCVTGNGTNGSNSTGCDDNSTVTTEASNSSAR